MRQSIGGTVVTVLLISFAWGMSVIGRPVFAANERETMLAYRLLNPIVIGDHKDLPDEWSDVAPVPMYRLGGSADATIGIKYDDEYWYIRVNALNDTKINGGDRCDVWLDPMHDGTSVKPQKDDVRFTGAWPAAAGDQPRYVAAISYGTGDGWSSKDTLPDGTPLTQLLDSFVSPISERVVYEFKVPRELIGNVEKTSFAVSVGQNGDDNYFIGKSVWPKGFGIRETSEREWPLNMLGILLCAGTSISAPAWCKIVWVDRFVFGVFRAGR
jgi:hypothetical protein